jgi:hypothetical protein
MRGCLVDQKEARYGSRTGNARWGWSAATSAVGVPGFRVHDLRHTAASVWLAAGADPKVVQRVLGHATAAVTMDLYCHMVDANLWQAAQLVGDISGTSEPSEGRTRTDSGPGLVRKILRSWAFWVERSSRLGLTWSDGVGLAGCPRVKGRVATFVLVS